MVDSLNLTRSVLKTEPHNQLSAKRPWPSLGTPVMDGPLSEGPRGPAERAEGSRVADFSGQDVGLIPPLFHCLGAWPELLHCFVAKQACSFK